MIAQIDVPGGWVVLLSVGAVAALIGWALGRRPKQRGYALAAKSLLAQGSTTPAEVVAPAVPRRKLFLSWAAVMTAVQNRTVTDEDLDQSLFCTSVAEMSLAEEYSPYWLERLHPIFIKASREYRMICPTETTHYNNTTARQVNELLARHGGGALTWGDQDSTLEQIPLYACVPSVSDGSYEALWATHPLRGDWKRCWGRSAAELEAEFAGVPDEPARGPSWTDELNRPIIDELRQRHERPAGGAEADQEEAEGDDPADAWKKGRPADEE